MYEVLRGSICTWLAVVLVLGACSGDDTGAPAVADPTVPAPTTTVPVPASTSTTIRPSTTLAPTPTTASTTTTTTTTTTTATTTTTVPPAPDPPTVVDGVLRPNGLGPHDFGADRAVVEAWLTDLFGPPTPDPDGPVVWMTCGHLNPLPCGQATVLNWPPAGLSVGFRHRVDGEGEASGSLFEAWTVADGAWDPGQIPAPGATWSDDAIDVRLVTGEGIGLGSTVTELEAAFPTVGFLGWHDQAFQPSGFYVADSGGAATTGSETAFEGDLDWNVVLDVQAALNARGADLVVDGIAGPATRAAIADFQARNDLSGVPETLDALGIAQPDPAAHVIRLSGGGWFWEFECGDEVSIFGFPDSC